MTQREQRVRDLLAESGLADEPDELVARLASLEAAVPEQPPEPSPQLAALLTRPAPPASVTAIGRRPSRLLIASAVAFGTVAAGGLAAAANELPPGAQSLVADLSERYLPFELPEPVVVPGEGDTGAGAPGSSVSDGGTGQDAGGDPIWAPRQAEPGEAPHPPAAPGPAPAAEPAVVAPSPTIAAAPPTSSPTQKQAAAEPAPPATQAPGDGAPAGGNTAAAGAGEAVQGPTTGRTPVGTSPQPAPQPSPSTAPPSPATSPDSPQGTPSGISTGNTPGGETTSAGPTNGPSSGTDTGTVRGREGGGTAVSETEGATGDSPTSPAPSGSGEVSGTG